MTYANAPLAVPSVQNVVLNDTLDANSISANGFLASYATIEQLVVEAETWQNTAFRTSNEQLYAILGKCYSFYLAMCSDSVEAKSIRRALDDYVNLKRYSFGKGTHTLNKIVKCVFGFDRRRVSAYGIVLRAALAEKVSADAIPTFIRERGGVEEIRLAKSPTSMTTKQKAQAAEPVIATNQLGILASEALNAMLDAGKIGKNTLLIGTWQADGTVAVRVVVESDTALNAALAAHYAATKAEIAAAQKELALQAKAESAAASVQLAAASAKLVQ